LWKPRLKPHGKLGAEDKTAASFTDHDLKPSLSEIGANVRVANDNLEEGRGLENIYRARNFRFDKRPLRRFLPAKFAAINFGLLRSQSTYPPVKV
jgi:hypothetical protein